MCVCVCKRERERERERERDHALTPSLTQVHTYIPHSRLWNDINISNDIKYFGLVRGFLWYINLRGLFNTKAIFVEEQYKYSLTHSWGPNILKQPISLSPFLSLSLSLSLSPHTHTHTHTYIYIYMYKHVYIY